MANNNRWLLTPWAVGRDEQSSECYDAEERMPPDESNSTPMRRVTAGASVAEARVAAATQALGKDFSVVLRVRPVLPGEPLPADVRLIEVASDKAPAALSVEEDVLGFRGRAGTRQATFPADLVLNQADAGSAEQVYAGFVLPLLALAVGGGVGTLFAYGQTNAGKTHLVTRLCALLAGDLPISARRQGLEQPVKVSVSALEIAGASVTDLLAGAPVKLLEDTLGKVQCGAVEQVVQSAAEFTALVERVFKARRTSATFKNEQSSRSHCIVRVHFADALAGADAEPGCLSIVDLAGSERAAKDAVHHTPEQRKSSIEINKSLMTLKECILRRSNLANGSAAHQHVPYRASKLTVLLKDSFELACGKPSHTVMVAALSPLDVDKSATLNTLRYASELLVTPPREQPPPDPRNPATWTHSQVLDWVRLAAGAFVSDPAAVCPHESGAQLCRIPEAELIRRLIAAAALNGKVLGPKRARDMYLSLWKEIIDARTRSRRAEHQRWRSAQKTMYAKRDREYLQVYQGKRK